ncbi:hypothetical protein BD410DRAFT_790307 [Rickenella mellea]|uniref:HNH nuclease domain-containing protein n=1 Tax=Rickenella mellea TaxID=50990 RepID=A0A4Y7Q0N0_9AGAM|nr:hypothetical protein BD410DRAFT_790307 [Rickenella mellea]
MPPLPRNVQVYSPHTDPPTIVAGINQHGTTSIEMFYKMLNIVLVVQTPWYIYLADEQYQPLDKALRPNDIDLLPLGMYVILSPNKETIPVSLTPENFRPRILSADKSGTSTPHKMTFRNRIRDRDDRCCVTRLLTHGLYYRFRASHIFPISHKDVWDKLNLSNYFDDDAPDGEQGPNSINSVQNGLLLRSDHHAGFNAYDFAINPDDGYRIFDFFQVGDLHGQVLWINENVPPKYRPSPHLLREHFKQCVLINVKGAGRRTEDWIDPEDEHDLSDFAQWGQSIQKDGPSRLELELRARLYV